MVGDLDVVVDDDLLPLSHLFRPRPRNHHLTRPPPLPPPPSPPARNDADAAFSAGDLVWAKAFPYTWWPGLLRRLRGSSALVHLFGCGGGRPRWFRLSRLRGFEDGYASSSSSSSRAKLSAEISLAIEELGRRSLMGLMCPCQRYLVGPRRLPRGAADLARREFVAADIAHFVRRRAVCAWGDGGEEDDPRVVKFLAGVIAFRRSFGGKGDFNVRRLVGMVLDMAVGNAVGVNAVGRTVEIVMAHRRFVSETPNWVFRELMDVGDDSSSSMGSEGSDGEELEESLVGSFYIEDAEGMVSTHGDTGSSLNIVTDSMVGVEELTDYLQETRIVVNSSSHGISAVCTLNTEMDIDSFIEDADNATEGERTELINSRSELQSGESVILQDHPEPFLEFGKEQACTACHNGYKTRGETTDILQEALTELHSLASDPCHNLKKNHKARLAVLLELRSFLFQNVFASESMSPNSIHDDLELSNSPAPEQDLPHVSVGKRHLKDGGAMHKSDVMYKNAPCANDANAFSSEGHQFCMMEIDEVVNAIVNQDCEVGCHELLEDIRSLAVDVFCLGSQNLELFCQNFLHLRQLTFLNMCDVLSTPSSVVPHPSNSELEKYDISNCDYGAIYSDTFQEKQAYLLSGTQKLVESSLKETHITSEVNNDILDPKKRTESNHMADNRTHQLSDMPQECQKCSPSSQSNFTGRKSLKSYEYLYHLKNLAVDLFCSEACFVEETCQKFLHYRKLAFLNDFYHSVDHDVKFSFGREDGFVSRNKQSVQIEKNSETCAGMEKMHNMAKRSTTCAHHVAGKISADSTNTEDPCMCITAKDVTDFQNRLDNDTLIEVSANIEPNSSLSGASNCHSGSVEKRTIYKSVASGNSDVETVSGLSGASKCDAGSFKKGVVDGSVASENCEIHQTEILRSQIDLNSSSNGEILHVDWDAADNTDMGANTVKNDHVSSQCLRSMDEDAKRNEARLLVAKGHGRTPGPILKDNFCVKRRHEHILPYQSKVQKHQPGFSLGRLYASPLMAETSKLAQKVKSANNSKYNGLCKTLHMKFPKDFQLPSKEELEKKFRVFGRLDRSRTKIFFYTGAAKVVFLKAADAQTAYVYAIKKRVFSCVDVRFWFDEHEMFREGKTRGPSSISPGEPSLSLKSCLRKPGTHKEKDQRKDYKVKFTTDDSPCPSTATSKTAYFPSTISDNIPSQAEDISGPMLHLLVKCDEVVTAIKKALGLESYYSIFAYTYDLSAKS